MDNKLNYTLVWKECGENSELAKRFYVPDFVGYLPFFLEDDDVSTFKEGRQVYLSEEQLLKGILFGLWEFENGGNKPWHTEIGRQTLLYLLDVLGKGFKFPNPEEMVLNTASNVRSQHGNTPSCQILESGLQLIPGSSKIKSDMICDYWEIAAADEGEEEGLSERQEGMLDQILILIDQINMRDIEPKPREIISFLGLYSLILLVRARSVPGYMAKYISPNVSNKKLMEKAIALTTNPQKASIEPLKSIL